jgi:hypothetical protein
MMLKAIRVSAMLLVLVGSAYAGEILNPPAPQAPRTSAVEEHSSDDEDFAETAITTTQIMLTVLVSLLP